MPLSRRRFLHSAALGSASLALNRELDASASARPAARSTASSPPRRPNLLFLWTDQHRWDVVPWAGNNAVKAQNFFAPFAEKSFVFHGAYVAQPVCTPSRGTVMTGLLPHNHGSIQNNIHLDPAKRCIAEYVPEEYATAYFGKWHLGDENKAQHGFKEWRSIEDNYRKYYTDPALLSWMSDYHNFLLKRGFPPDQPDTDSDGAPVFSRTMSAAMTEQYTKVAFLAGEAEKFLRARRDGRPFLLHVNSLEPHPPSYGPLNELHDPAKMPAGPAFARPLGDNISKLVRRHNERTRRDGYKNNPIDTEHDWRRLRANYYGLVSMVDNAYARIMHALEESGQADNTIVVYTSDHGDMCGDHCLMQKGNFYEGSTHVPLAIHVPWLSRRRVDIQGPICNVDLVPTLLDLMGAGVPAGLDGTSRVGALRDPPSWKAGNVVIEWHDADDHAVDGRSLRTADNWKLNLYRGDSSELYDLNTDPGELRNLARDAAHRDRIRRLADEIRAWQARHDDPMTLQA